MKVTTSYSLNIVWLMLLVSTVLTAWISDINGGTNWSTTSIFLIASLKIALVMLYFMELRFSPRAWQFAYLSWLAMVSIVVTVGFIAA